MPAIDCTRSARTKFEIMYSAAFNNVPALFTPDHISHYFHHAHHLITPSDMRIGASAPEGDAPPA